jgi:acetyl-CoA carboxylase biotin carboxyl carrier protein
MGGFMDTKKLKNLIELAKESGLSELTVEHKDDRVTLKFPYGQSVAAQPMMAAPAAIPSAGASATAPAPVKDENLIEVTSPFVGTFYRASSPDAEAYVKEGDIVSPGKILCIVEAMKIMNEIESEVSGEIAEICVENETYVEFGQVLFKVRKK